MRGNAFFITATGTELGKTLITAGLAWQLRQQGRKVLAIKPVASGFTSLESSDTGILLAAQGREVTLHQTDAITPWRFAAPISPHLAAEQEESTLTPKDILIFCETAIAQPCLTLIEGAGGVLSPLVQGYTQGDLLQELNIPAIVVAGSYVGAISHTLCTIEAMQARKIAVQAVVISASADSASSVEQTRHSIASHLKTAVPIFTIPRIAAKTSVPLWQQLPPLTGIFEHE